MPPTQEPPQQINSVWASSALAAPPALMTLPSGQTCRAKPIGLQGVMEAGILGEADSLTAYIGKEYLRKVKGAKGKPDGEEIDPRKLMQSPDALKKIVFLVDRITPMVVVEPKVYPHFEYVNDGQDTRMIPQEERFCGACGLRQQDHDGENHPWASAVYTDMIGLEDKMFLFNFALGGVREVESFRKESAEAMGVVADGQGVPDYAEQPDGNRAERRRRPPRRRRSS